MAGESNITKRDTNASSTKGGTSTQAYLAPTVKTTVSTPANFTEERTQVGIALSESTSTKANIRETRTSNGIGKTGQQLEDKGVKLKFRIQLHQRQPIVRQV